MADPYAAKRRARLQAMQSDPLQYDPLLLKTIASKSLGSVAAAGMLIDLPDSMIRDTLSNLTGHWANPLNQLLDPFNPEKRTSGRDLLENWGAVEKNKPGLDAGDVAGVGLEIGISPLTYLSFGARGGMTVAAKAAEKANLLDDVQRAAVAAGHAVKGPREARLLTTPKELLAIGPDRMKRMRDFVTAAHGEGVRARDIKNMPLYTDLMSWNVPFTQKHLGRVPLPWGLNMPVARGLDAMGHAIRYSPPVAKLYSQFGSRTMGAVSEVGQKAADERMVPATAGAVAKGTMKYHEDILRPLGKADDFSVEKMYEKMFPGQPQSPGNLALARREVLKNDVAAREYLEMGKPLPPHLRHLQQAADNMDTAYAKQFEAEDLRGLDTDRLDDVVESVTGKREDAFHLKYAAREAVNLPKGFWRRTFGSRAYSTKHPFQTKREGVLRGMVGGTGVIQEMSVDPTISGIAHRGYTQTVTEGARANAKLGKLTPIQLSDIKQVIERDYMHRIRPPGYKPMEEKELDALASYIGTLDPRHAEESIPLFEMNPFSSGLHRLVWGERAVAMADQVTAFLAENVVASIDDIPKGVRLGEALKKAYSKGDTENVRDRAVSLMHSALENGSPAAKQAKATIDNIMQASFHPSGDAADDAIEAAKNLRAAFKDLVVPADVADDVGRIMQFFQSPEAVTEAMQLLDEAQRVWKVYQTGAFIPFHVRNNSSGILQSWFGHAADAKAIGDGFALGFGRQKITGAKDWPFVKEYLRQAGRPATDDEATLLIRQWMSAHELAPYGRSMADDMTIGARMSEMQLPGMEPMFARKQAGVNQFNPLDVNNFFWTRWGQSVGNKVETVNRAIPFMYLLRKGWSPEAAAKRVKLLQVDYSARASLDPRMRRIFPFWSFMKRSFLPVIDELMTRPGGRMGTLIRMTPKMRGDDEIVPEHVADTLAIPLGTGKSGQKRYLSQFGLMHEDPLSFGFPIPGIGTGVKPAFLEAMSRLNPLLKGVAEYGSGKLFFQKGPMGARELDDADPTLARLFSNVRDLATGKRTKRVKPIFGDPGLEYFLDTLGGRTLTTARQLTTPHKWDNPLLQAMNLLTGVRVTDVTPAARRAVIDQAADEMLKEFGGREFKRMWIPQEALEGLSPTEAAQLKRWMALKRVTSEEAKQESALRQFRK